MDFEKAKLNPAAVFKSPQEIVSSQELSREQKIEILRRWEQDARLMEVAEEESMPGPQPKLLQPIRDALHALNYWPDTEHSSPSKPYYLNRLDEHRERRAEYEMLLLRKKRATLRLSGSPSDLYFDIVSFDSSVIPGNPFGGRGTEDLSSSQIIGCAVPGAGHLFTLKGPF